MKLYEGSQHKCAVEFDRLASFPIAPKCEHLEFKIVRADGAFGTGRHAGRKREGQENTVKVGTFFKTEVLHSEGFHKETIYKYDISIS